MDQHRNIQLTYSPTDDDIHDTLCAPGLKGNNQTISQLLLARTDILGFHIIDEQHRINISVHHLQYRDILLDLQRDIQAQDFPYALSVKIPQNFPSDASHTTASTVTQHSKYHHILSSIITTASATSAIGATPTVTSNRTNAWHRRSPNIPILIDFNDADFPILPSATPRLSRTPGPNHETASDTLTITTVHNAVTEALALVRAEHLQEQQLAQAEHKTEMESLRSEIHELKVTFQMLAQTISTQSATILLQQMTLHSSIALDESSPPRKRRDTTQVSAKTPTRTNTRIHRHSRSSTAMHDDDTSPSEDDSDATPQQQTHSTMYEDSTIPPYIDPAPNPHTFRQRPRLAPHAPPALSSPAPAQSANHAFHSTHPTASDADSSSLDDMMSTRSHEAPDDKLVPSTQGDAQLSLGRED
jgi:hypothetical protein